MQAISGNSSYTLLLLEKKLPSHFLSPFFSKSMMLWFSVITRCLFNTTQQQDLGEMGMRKDWICILHTSSHVNLTLACVLFACFLHLQPPSPSSSFSQHSVDNFPSWLPSDFMSDEASRANFFLRRHSHVSLSTSFLYNRHWQSKGKNGGRDSSTRFDVSRKETGRRSHTDQENDEWQEKGIAYQTPEVVTSTTTATGLSPVLTESLERSYEGGKHFFLHPNLNSWSKLLLLHK